MPWEIVEEDIVLAGVISSANFGFYMRYGRLRPKVTLKLKNAFYLSHSIESGVPDLGEVTVSLTEEKVLTNFLRRMGLFKRKTMDTILSVPRGSKPIPEEWVAKVGDLVNPENRRQSGEAFLSYVRELARKGLMRRELYDLMDVYLDKASRNYAIAVRADLIRKRGTDIETYAVKELIPQDKTPNVFESARWRRGEAHKLSKVCLDVFPPSEGWQHKLNWDYTEAMDYFMIRKVFRVPIGASVARIPIVVGIRAPFSIKNMAYWIRVFMEVFDKRVHLYPLGAEYGAIRVYHTKSWLINLEKGLREVRSELPEIISRIGRYFVPIKGYMDELEQAILATLGPYAGRIIVKEIRAKDPDTLAEALSCVPYRAQVSVYRKFMEAISSPIAQEV